jgi:hypothetical protein
MNVPLFSGKQEANCVRIPIKDALSLLKISKEEIAGKMRKYREDHREEWNAYQRMRYRMRKIDKP